MLIGPGAESDLIRILDQIAAESAQGARTVADEIFGKLELLEIFPRGAPPDDASPELPQPLARSHRAIAGSYEIRYAFPVEYGGERDVVAILLVRDARRDALEVREIHDRFVALMLEAEEAP